MTLSQDRTPAWLSTPLAVGILLAATLALFAGYLSPSTHQVISLPRDLSQQFIWWRSFGFEELKKGHLALWDPHLFCGAPFFGGFQSALLYPPNWLFMALPLAFCMNLIMALHVFLAGFFTFLWLQKRGSHWASSLLGAWMFMFSGAYFVRILEGQISNLCTMTWIPLIFLAIDGFRSEAKFKWVALGAMAVAFQIFAGHIQYVYYTALFGAVYVVFSLFQTQKKAVFLGGFLSMYLLGALLSAVQLLAGWDATAESVRNHNLSPGILTMLEVNPERLCGLFMPDFFGGWKDYWGGGFYDEGNPFVGVTGILLALFALGVSKSPGKKFFAGSALFMNVLMWGDRTPLFLFLCKTVPLFGRFRGIGRLNVLVDLCLVVLAAMGLDEIFRSPEVLKKFMKTLRNGSGIFLVLALVFFITPRVGGARLFKEYLAHADGMAWSIAQAGLFLAGLALVAYFSYRHRVLRWLFLIVAFGELFLFARSNLTSFDLTQLQAKCATIQNLYDKDPGDYRVWATWGDYTLGTSGFDIWGEDPMMPSRYCDFACRTQNDDVNNDILSHDFFRYRVPALGLLRLRYIVQTHSDNWTVEKSGLKEAPRTFLTDKWEVLDYPSILDRTTRNGFKATQKVLLESAPEVKEEPGKLKGKVQVQDLDSDRIEIKASLSKPAILVMTDNYSKGWRALPLPGDDQWGYRVLPANGFQRAIPLQAGEHHFLLQYQPPHFMLGCWISWFSWFLFFACLFATVPLSGRRKGHSR